MSEDTQPLHDRIDEAKRTFENEEQRLERVRQRSKAEYERVKQDVNERVEEARRDERDKVENVRSDAGFDDIDVKASMAEDLVEDIREKYSESKNLVLEAIDDEIDGDRATYKKKATFRNGKFYRYGTSNRLNLFSLVKGELCLSLIREHIGDGEALAVEKASKRIREVPTGYHGFGGISARVEIDTDERILAPSSVKYSDHPDVDDDKTVPVRWVRVTAYRDKTKVEYVTERYDDETNSDTIGRLSSTDPEVVSHLIEHRDEIDRALEVVLQGAAWWSDHVTAIRDDMKTVLDDAAIKCPACEGTLVFPDGDEYECGDDDCPVGTFDAEVDA